MAKPRKLRRAYAALLLITPARLHIQGQAFISLATKTLPLLILARKHRPIWPPLIKRLRAELSAMSAAKHGCKVYGYGKQITAPEGGEIRLEAGDDLTFNPDVNIAHGDIIKGDGWTIEAIHTPGHTSNHMCYALKEENILFSGDHIMGWSTSVVSPPDGHMGDYLNSLEDIRSRRFDTIWPTHGPAITEPIPFVDAYIEHRHKREAQILGALEQGLTKITDIVKVLYADINPRLHPAAAHSVLSHLIYLCEPGRVTCSGETPSLKCDYCECSEYKPAKSSAVA